MAVRSPDDQVSALEALADPTRRSIFELLGEAPRAVVDIARYVPISRPAVSQHLRVLKDARLVTVRSAGTRHIYSLDPAGIATVRDYFARFWTDALAAYSQAAALPEAPTTAAATTAAPTGAAPTGAAPTGAAPTGAAPRTHSEEER